MNGAFPIGLKHEDVVGKEWEVETLTALVFERVKKAYELKARLDAHDRPILLEEHPTPDFRI